MSEYVKRTTAPSKDSKYYYSDNIFYQCGYGMPNCTAYAWGRWYELLGSKPKLYTGNAETWYPKGTSYDGYKRGQTPKLGAVACWAKGVAGKSSDGAGHVAIVEEIYSDGSILTSNSAWKGTNFYTKKLAKGYNVNGYTFQGFIYLPIEFTEPTKPETDNATTSKKATEPAQSYDASLAGTYKVTANSGLNVRNGAGTNKSVMVAIPKGTSVKNYGYYTSVSGVKWLYIQFEYKNVQYTGFATSKYLSK